MILLRRARTAWDRLKQPPVLSALWASLYVTIAVLIGAPTLATTAGHAQTYAYGIELAIVAGTPLIAGGLIAAVSLWWGVWVIERGAILILTGGLIARSIIVVWLPTVSIITRIVEVGSIIAILLALAIRYATIWGLDLDPQE